MKNVLNNFKNILKDKKELVVNLVLIVLTVIITMSAMKMFEANKSKKSQENNVKKQIYKYEGQELLQPNEETINDVKQEENISSAEQTAETNISEDIVEEDSSKTSVGYSTTVTPETMKIMGYEEINADKAITFIVSLVGEDNIDKIKLNGTSLNFHISNTNKAAKAENVNAYFVLAQQLLETGNLKFENSSVKPEYYNFAGLGATDSNPKPNKFFSNYDR